LGNTIPSEDIRGDIFLNLFMDRLEVHNPGLLPLGVSPQNILHRSVQRNSHLAKVFYDLKLMEKEGSGYDKIYAILLSAAKAIPVVQEGHDRVSVIIKKRIANKDIINFIDKANTDFQLKIKGLERKYLCALSKPKLMHLLLTKLSKKQAIINLQNTK
jgi:ATP-dependent DNA helicase RecG